MNKFALCLLAYNQHTPGTQRGSGGGGYTRRAQTTVIASHLANFGGGSRSVNGGGIRIVTAVTGSNAASRAHSQGLRPGTCTPGGSGPFNPLDWLWGLRNAAQNLLDQGQGIINNPLGTAIDAIWDLLDFVGQMRQVALNLPAKLQEMTWQKTLAELNQARKGNFGLAAGMVIGALPVIGSMYDALSLQLDYDPISGVSLSSFEKAAIAAGLAAGFMGIFSFIDEALELGSKATRYLDDIDVSDMARAGKGISGVDEIVDVGKRLNNHTLQGLPDLNRLKSLDSLDDAATLKRLQNLDEFTGGNRAVQRGDELRRSLRGNSDSGALSQRLAGASCGNSFTAGTLVHTEEGQKPIEEVKEGDKVLAEDPETGEQGYFEVVAATSHPTDEILHITIEAEAEASNLDSSQADGDNDRQQLHTDTMEVTPEHPVYVEGRG